MPQWAGSCWYYLRFIDPTNSGRLIDKEKEKYWMPVDLYVGGAEHAVLHLLYARFWHKVGDRHFGDYGRDKHFRMHFISATLLFPTGLVRSRSREHKGAIWEAGKPHGIRNKIGGLERRRL